MKPHRVAGKRFELLDNGAGYHPRVFAAIQAARCEVQLETFPLRRTGGPQAAHCAGSAGR